MQIQTLHLKNFRNYREIQLEIPAGVVVFYGANGQGKTNLIESFHLLLRGQSFRPSKRESLIQVGEEQALVNAKLEKVGLRHDVSLRLTHERKSLIWNNKPAASPTLAREFPMVLFSPESLMAIKDEPELRRQLLNDAIMTHSATSVKTLRDFQRALRTRNRLLKSAKLQEISYAEARGVLESLDATYLPLAAELTVARLRALNALQDDFQRAVSDVLQKPGVEVSVDYLISEQNAVSWTRSDILTAMHNRVQELRAAELDAGISLVGPHKHDIRFLFAQNDSRFYCSQGQQRALILSFKMAQILYHYRSYQVYPFLLLDDVLSELDPVRRDNLVKFLRDIPAQIFLTTTDLSFSTDFGERKLNVFHVENGTVQKQQWT